MDTTRILAFRHPSQNALLLDSLVTTMDWVTREQKRVSDRSELPSVLQRIVIMAVKTHHHWAAWMKDGVPRLYVAKQAVEYSRNVRRSSLELQIYNALGQLRHQGLWVSQRDGGWHCAETRQTPAVTPQVATKKR